MKLYNKGIETKRAFIAFDNIQHISWSHVDYDNVEVKIYSSASSAIIQKMPSGDFLIFLNSYKEYMGCV